MLSKLQPTCASARRNPVPTPSSLNRTAFGSSEIYGSDVHHPSVCIARAATGGDKK